MISIAQYKHRTFVWYFSFFSHMCFWSLNRCRCHPHQIQYSMDAIRMPHSPSVFFHYSLRCAFVVECSIHFIHSLINGKTTRFIWFKLAASDCSNGESHRLHVHQSIYVLWILTFFLLFYRRTERERDKEINFAPITSATSHGTHRVQSTMWFSCLNYEVYATTAHDTAHIKLL